MSYPEWDLTSMREMWKVRAEAAERAKAGIDTADMTRPRRHPHKSQWLRENADPGPFLEADAATKEAERNSTR
jgi:hypothetical protein